MTCMHAPSRAGLLLLMMLLLLACCARACCCCAARRHSSLAARPTQLLEAYKASGRAEKEMDFSADDVILAAVGAK